MTGADAELDVRGQRLILLGERAVYWHATKSLLVADPHFGKAAAFRAAGVPVPRGTTTENLSRLSSAIDRTRPERIVFLGDFLHAREGRAVETLDTVNAWRSKHASIDMVLVRGNHDKHAGDPPQELDIRCVDGPVVEEPFVFAHRPVASPHGYVLCGHVHPAVRLVGPARERSTLPCFWFGTGLAILPAFGEFTGLAVTDVGPNDRVWVIADGDVIAMTPASISA
jgi:uncharacterized protein